MPPRIVLPCKETKTALPQSKVGEAEQALGISAKLPPLLQHARAGQASALWRHRQQTPYLRPDSRTLFVFVMERLGVALRVLQDPSEDTLVRNHRPARHVVASNVLQKRGLVEFLAIDQPRAPNERAAGLALSEMYQTPPCRRAAANLPVFLSGEDFVQPIFLHDQNKLRAPLDAAPPTSRFLLASTIDIASVVLDSLR